MNAVKLPVEVTIILTFLTGIVLYYFSMMMFMLTTGLQP